MWEKRRNWCGRKLQAKACSETGSMKPLAPRCELILIYSNNSYSSWKVYCANTYVQREQHAKIQLRRSLRHLPIALVHRNNSCAIVGTICETKKRKKSLGPRRSFNLVKCWTAGTYFWTGFFLTTISKGIFSKSLFCFFSDFKNFKPRQKQQSDKRE